MGENHVNQHPESFYNTDKFPIVSSTDYTGMVPTPPLTEDEVEGYADILHIAQPQVELIESVDDNNDHDEYTEDTEDTEGI